MLVLGLAEVEPRRGCDVGRTHVDMDLGHGGVLFGVGAQSGGGSGAEPLV